MQDQKFVTALKNDYRTAQLTTAERAMLDYVAKLTLAPAPVEEADIMRLRHEGFADKAILEINQITGFFAGVTAQLTDLG